MTNQSSRPSIITSFLTRRRRAGIHTRFSTWAKISLFTLAISTFFLARPEPPRKITAHAMDQESRYVQAQIDPRSAKPATAGGNAGPAGICATLFRHIPIETLTDSFTNGALWERESELAECVNRLHAPKTIPEATTFIRKTQELHNVRAIMLARALNFLGQEGMATKWMTAPIPKEGR